MMIVVLCEHGEAKPHIYFMDVPIPHDCPGGRVLNQAIIIERDENGEWPEQVIAVLGGAVSPTQHYIVRRGLDALASAQEEQ